MKTLIAVLAVALLQGCAFSYINYAEPCEMSSQCCAKKN